jgi:hypothetical protein
VLIVKKPTLVLILISALLSLTLIGVQTGKVAYANFVAQATTPPPQGTIPPTISIANSEINQSFRTLMVNIASASCPTKWSYFSLPEVYYWGDWMTNESFADYGETVRLYLSNAPSGTHTVTIRANQRCYYGNGDGVYFCRTESSLVVAFIVENTQPFSAKVLATSILDTSPPNVSILLTENETFVNSTVPLDFTVNPRVVQISYSLDGHDNVTIAGNTTLTGLSDGEHHITVYYVDIAGNIGASKTVYFSVEVPEPQPESEPFPTAYSMGTVAIIILVLLGSIFYVLKRK